MGGWHGLQQSLAPIVSSKGFAPDASTTTWKYTRSCEIKPHGRGMVRGLAGLWIRIVIWLLVHQLPDRTKSYVGQIHYSGQNTPAYRRYCQDVYPVSDHCSGIAALVLMNTPGKRILASFE